MVKRLERVALPVAALTWFNLILHSAHRLGIDFSTVYSGPHGLLRGASIYPTTDDPTGYFAREVPYYVHPPGAPVALAPFGFFSESVSGAAFISVSAAVFLVGLWRLAVRTPIPWIIILAAGLSLPVRDEIGVGNVDLLCAGLIALAITLRPRYRAVPLGLAIAVKPTVWPILALFGFDALLALGLAAALTLVGVLTIDNVSRFWENVIPYLAHGQQAVATIRTSLTDLAVAAGLPRSPVSIICGVALVAVVAFIALRVPADRRLDLAPLVVIAALTLSGYSFVPYAVYLIAVLPLLRPRDSQLWLLGISLYLIGTSDVWYSDGLPNRINTALDFRVLAGMLLLIPIATRALPRFSTPESQPFDPRPAPQA